MFSSHINKKYLDRLITDQDFGVLGIAVPEFWFVLDLNNRITFRKLYQESRALEPRTIGNFPWVALHQLNKAFSTIEMHYGSDIVRSAYPTSASWWTFMLTDTKYAEVDDEAALVKQPDASWLGADLTFRTDFDISTGGCSMHVMLTYQGSELDFKFPIRERGPGMVEFMQDNHIPISALMCTGATGASVKHMKRMDFLVRKMWEFFTKKRRDHGKIPTNWFGRFRLEFSKTSSVHCAVLLGRQWYPVPIIQSRNAVHLIILGAAQTINLGS